MENKIRRKQIYSGGITINSGIKIVAAKMRPKIPYFVLEKLCADICEATANVIDLDFHLLQNVFITRKRITN